jgi:hypothetical protein
MKKVLIVLILAFLLFIIAILPILAAQLYTFDDDAQGWNPIELYWPYIGHEAPGSMSVTPTQVTISKVVTLPTTGDLSFWADWWQSGGMNVNAIVSVDSTPVCTFSLPLESWQYYTCTLTYPGPHDLSLSGVFDELCDINTTCIVLFDEISVPEEEEGPSATPTPALPFRLYLPILYQAAIP